MNAGLGDHDVSMRRLPRSRAINADRHEPVQSGGPWHKQTDADIAAAADHPGLKVLFKVPR